ncbi:zinc finger matrin-type protein 2-like [Limulus polyphemus]|uniref:Zinc finger matrin-type protein 2-like n=1 Tax=Limulus polyphemus TaxID=6850 RepID=A0ABM1TRI8_LIMPO|nr:zinc finger matrin-type protein 2-like [Limulus polyphemus]
MASFSRPDDHRRKWDLKEFEDLAQKRIEEELDDDIVGLEKNPPVKRELLKPRDYKVDLDSKLGKTTVITKTTPPSQSGGYYCNVCDCVVKDSINFLDHINGKKHQQNLEMIAFQEERLKEYRKEKRRDRKRKAQESSEQDVDPDVAAMMGFSGFGSLKK